MSSKTGYPFHLPSPQEDLILTVSVGNTHLHWASHNGPNEDFNPKIFWRTPHIEEDDMGEDNLIQVLSRLIPDDAHDYIFGEETDASVEAAVRQSKLRDVPEISVYVVSTNQAQAESLEKLLKTVPSKFCLLDDDMFFTEEQGRYSTMGTDRLATLAGAAYMHGHPALVFDGGTATTYSATDSAGNILGGGIAPGIYTKLKSMAESTDALPDVSKKVPEKVSAALDQVSGNEPIPTFARSTEDAMLGDLFQELAMKGRNVIGNWLKKAYRKNTKPPKADSKLNTEKRVICTGGDADVLYLLLSPDSGGLIEMDEGKSTLEYEVEVSKHLIHYGITAVLYYQGKLQEKKTNNVTKIAGNEHIGKRVAKVFDVESDDGDNIYRGTVKELADVDGFDGYRVLYDDGDKEDVSVNTLFEMFELYNTHGEKAKKTANIVIKKYKTVAGADSPKLGEKKSEKKRPAKSATENGIKSKALVGDNKKAEKKKPAKQTQKKSASVNGGEDKAMVSDSPKTATNRRAEAKHPEPSENGVAAASTTTNVDDKADGKKLAKSHAKKATVNGESSQASAAGPEEAAEEKTEKKKPGRQKKRANDDDEAAPAAKKAKLTQSYASMVKNSQPTVFIQRRVAKEFEDGEVYFGTVTQYDESEPPPFWKIHYDDGDEEDYEKKDLIKALKLYDKEEGNDPSKKK